MEWIKKNPHLLALGLLALALTAAAGMVVMQAQSFDEKFESVKISVPQKSDVPPQDLAPIEGALAGLEKPAEWTPPDTKVAGPLFVPVRYSIEGDRPKKVGEGSTYKDSLSKEPIPDRWFLDNNLPLTNPIVARQDPDGDGFFNEDEWRGKTDPNNKESHPAYHTKLFLTQWIRIPFRILFQTYDGDPKKPDAMTFQINAIDRGKRTEFLKLKEKVPSSPFVLDKFEQKNKVNLKTEAEEDVSELTLINSETGDSVVLVLTKITDSPDSFGLFTYLWTTPTTPIRPKKLQSFVLPPNKDATKDLYKLLDIKETEALIQLPSGEKLTVPRLPAGYP